MAKDISVEIGFVGGSNTAVGIPEGDVDAFTTALTSGGDPWYTLTSGDGTTFIVDTTKVVFVRVASSSRSIGFAHA